MKETKKIRVKVKKRKIKIKNIILFLISLILLFNMIYCILNIKIKNIYILNNNILSDKEIIYNSNLEDYPSYLLTSKKKIINKLKDNPYIKDIKIIKKRFKLYIEVYEYRILALYNNKLLLESGKLVDNINNISNIPIVINDIDIEEFSKYFKLTNDSVLEKISQIEYTPNKVDKERYLLLMNDGNSVYITLKKIDKINKYNDIIANMNNRNGIIYLDSGDYIELK